MTRARFGLALGALVALLALAMIVAVLAGAVAIAPGDVLAALAGRSTGPEATIIRDLRLPRVLAAAVVGAALAAAGVLLQGLLRNPLADPFVTGTSAGATLAAVSALAVGAPALAVPAAAFGGALAAVWVVWRLARVGGAPTVVTVLLAGVVLTAFSGALVMLLLTANDRLTLHLRATLGWLQGGVAVIDQGELLAAALLVAVGLVAAFALAPRLDAFAFGEETAATLGIDVGRVTAATLAATALLAGAAVALAGLVGFVGLVVPHALRGIVGASHRRLVLAAVPAGAATLVIADLGARTLLAPAELPAGVITGLVGAPFFLALLVRSRRIAA